MRAIWSALLQKLKIFSNFLLEKKEVHLHMSTNERITIKKGICALCFFCSIVCVLFLFGSQFLFIYFFFLVKVRKKSLLFYLPDIWEKHCVRVVTTKPEDKAVANKTEETDAPTPVAAAAPHTINTYKKDDKHSAKIDLKRMKMKTKKCLIFFFFFQLTNSDANGKLLWNRKR